MPARHSARALFSESNVPAELRKEATESNAIFVHSRLDDYGLSPAEFRVYGHIARRAGHGAAYAANKSIARVCRLHPQTVRKALRILTAHRLLLAEPRHGSTTIYRLTPASAWRPPKRIDGDPLETNTGPSVSRGSAAKRIQGQPSETDTAKGNPIEGNPKKVNPHSPPKGDCLKDTGSSPTQEEEIYAAYLKQVGKPAALRAIRRALTKRPFDFLLERTRLYAQTCNSPSEFIPNPSTWFNQERFNDDPATWRRTVGATGKPQPAIIRSDNFGCGVSKL